VSAATASGKKGARVLRDHRGAFELLELTAAEPELTAAVTVIERMLSEDRGSGDRRRDLVHCADAFLTLSLQWLI
jgi:hypothetical protein